MTTKNFLFLKNEFLIFCFVLFLLSLLLTLIYHEDLGDLLAFELLEIILIGKLSDSIKITTFQNRPLY